MQSAFFPQQKASNNHTADVATAAADAGPQLKVAVPNSKSNPSRHAGYVGTSHGTPVRLTSGSHLRFPSSRRYLWDRTAAGPQVLVEALVGNSSIYSCKRGPPRNSSGHCGLLHQQCAAAVCSSKDKSVCLLHRTSCHMSKWLHQHLDPYCEQLKPRDNHCHCNWTGPSPAPIKYQHCSRSMTH